MVFALSRANWRLAPESHADDRWRLKKTLLGFEDCLSSDESKLLQVTIPPRPPVAAALGGNLTLPCLVSLTHPPPAPVTNGRHAVLSLPRVKWSLLTGQEETEILVARGDRVRVSEAYRGRASLLYYARSPADLTLHLEGLRRNDSGVYRCEVLQGVEGDDDVATVKVKGQSRAPSSRTAARSLTSCGRLLQGWCSITAMPPVATPLASRGQERRARPPALGWPLRSSSWPPTTAATTSVTPAGCRTARSGEGGPLTNTPLHILYHNTHFSEVFCPEASQASG